MSCLIAPGEARCRGLALAALVVAFHCVPPHAWSDEGEGNAGDSLPRVAVLHFSAPILDEWWLSQGDGTARDIFSQQLEASGRFEVVVREEVDRLASEEGLLVRGELSPAAAVKAGRILGVDFVVGGALTEYAAVIPGFMRRGVGKLPGVGMDQCAFVTAFAARLWRAESGRMLWADWMREETPITKVRALELRDGDPDPRATFRRELEPMLTKLARRLATEPALP